MFRYIGAEIAGIVYGTMREIGDAEKQPELMQIAHKLGQKPGSGYIGLIHFCKLCL